MEGWLPPLKIEEETEELSATIPVIFIISHFKSNIYRQTVVVVSLACVYVATPSKGRGDRGGPRQPGCLPACLLALVQLH